jgi:hypothetical protein
MNHKYCHIVAVDLMNVSAIPVKVLLLLLLWLYSPLSGLGRFPVS